jgi:lysophospholipid acyltransferase (LPLAT)-like uncharacterized protein
VLKRFLDSKFFISFGILIIKIISSTYRIKIINPETEQNVLKMGKVPIYASWHQRFFPGIALIGARNPISIMISQSRDGEMISKIATSFGWHPVRGSSSRGGSHALKELYKLIGQGYKVGHIVDGPRGPHGIVKSGLLLIAQQSGMPIIPTIISPEKKWVFNSWDRFMVPKPFSRIIIRFGDKIFVSNDTQGEAFEEKRFSIERMLEELYIETDKFWTNPEKIDQFFTS